MIIARASTLTSALALLAGCHDQQASDNADDKLRKVIARAMCAKTKEDRAAGLANVAQEAAGVAEGYREDTVQTMAEEAPACKS